MKRLNRIGEIELQHNKYSPLKEMFVAVKLDKAKGICISQIYVIINRRAANNKQANETTTKSPSNFQ